MDQDLPYEDRRDAGRRLGAALRHLRSDEAVVLGLPRGGIPVAAEVAKALDAPMDVFVVRKLGVPGHEELAMGAIASGDVRVLNDRVVADLGLTEGDIATVSTREEHELQRRERIYREDRRLIELRDRIVVIVDDGLATGATMRAAVVAVRAHRPKRVVVAVPAGSARTCEELAADADEVVCLATPEPFLAVGSWYRDFSQTSDDEVRVILDEWTSIPR